MRFCRFMQRMSVILIICLLLANCNSNSTASDVQVEENSVDRISSEETVLINNCGNSANSEQVKERAFSTNIGGGVEIGANYQVIEGSVSAQYGQYRSEMTSQRLIAAPDTNMEFVLRWSEEIRAGNVMVNGETGSYSVRIPISVEQISSRDLGCPDVDTPIRNPTSPAAQLEPESTSEIKNCSGNPIPSFWHANDGAIGHNIGKPMNTQEWGAIADPNATFKEAALIFGPYIELAPGNYEVIFIIKAEKIIDSQNAIVARLNIGSNSGLNINTDLANQDVRFSQFVESGEYQEFRVPFRINSCTDNLEFRVFHKNKATVVVKSIDLQPQ